LWLSLAGVGVLAVAVAGPTASLPVGRSAGTVILAMDVSNSMSADDVAPSRLAAAQQAASAFIDAQPDTVDIGVVGFDQGALTTSLPTADRAVAKAAVQNLRTSGGTSLASAILGSLSAITGKTVTIGEDGALVVKGWAFNDHGTGPAREVLLSVDGTRDYPAHIGIYKDGLGGGIRRRDRRWAGLIGSIGGFLLEPGAHTIALKIVADDGRRAFLTDPVARVIRR